METTVYPKLGERVLCEDLENGLRIYVVPKPDFQKSYAFFATKYGSIDRHFCCEGQWQDTPAGVAHFLEHKMFDTAEGNALQNLAENGASPNAFTSLDITAYHFESTEKFYENLKILLSFVAVPYFTAESVAKEQGIIGQEIRMGEDEPEDRVFYAMLEGLYGSHPISTPIVGTVESIAQISAETLYECHRFFYEPANMVLCVVGNVEAEKILALAREVLGSKKGQAPQQRDYGEACKEKLPRTKKLSMEVSTPIFRAGWRLPVEQEGAVRLRQEILGELCCEALLGTSSPLYARLYAEGSVNKNYDYGYELYGDCAFLTLGGECREPEKLMAAIEDEVRRIGAEGLDEGLFERLKKAAYGARVRSLNSFENICYALAQGYFKEMESFRFPEIFDTIEKRDVEEMIRSCVLPGRRALAVVEPKEAAA